MCEMRLFPRPFPSHDGPSHLLNAHSVLTRLPPRKGISINELVWFAAAVRLPRQAATLGALAGSRRRRRDKPQTPRDDLGRYSSHQAGSPDPGRSPRAFPHNQRDAEMADAPTQLFQAQRFFPATALPNPLGRSPPPTPGRQSGNWLKGWPSSIFSDFRRRKSQARRPFCERATPTTPPIIALSMRGPGHARRKSISARRSAPPRCPERKLWRPATGPG